MSSTRARLDARSAALSTLCEQLNTPNARRMLEVLERVESQLLSGFYGFYGELAPRSNP